MKFRTLLALLLFSCSLVQNSEAADPQWMLQNQQFSIMMKARVDMVRAQAEMMKARAQIVTAQAQARKAYYEAAQLQQQAKSMAMDNELKYASTYYQKKQIRAAYKKQRASKPSYSSSGVSGDLAAVTPARR